DATHTLHLCLPAQLAFGADLASNTGDFRGEGIKLVDHRIDGVFELEDLALDVDSDLLGEVAAGDGCGDFSDVAHLGGEVAGHRIDTVGQVFPGSRNPLDLGLSAQLAVGADLARHAGHFRGE